MYSLCEACIVPEVSRRTLLDFVSRFLLLAVGAECQALTMICLSATQIGNCVTGTKDQYRVRRTVPLCQPGAVGKGLWGSLGNPGNETFRNPWFGLGPLFDSLPSSCKPGCKKLW